MNNSSLPPQPLISIISVNYNQANLTEAFIQSIQASDYENYEIIIVDNASKEDCRWLKEKYPEIILVLSKHNGGFAAGNYLGYEASNGDYLCFLNNDTTVEPDFLAPLVEFCEAHPEAGMLGPRILYAAKPHDVQFAGSELLRYSARVRWKNRTLSEEVHKDMTEPCDLVHGAAMFIPRKVIEEVGFMHQDYFLLYEEFDWCERIKKAGYTLYYIGASIVYHHSSATMKDAPFKRYYMTRNRLLFIRRNFRGMECLSSILFYCCLSFPAYIIKTMLKGKFKLTWAAFRGLFWHLKNFSISS